jgi:hypothetical protein
VNAVELANFCKAQARCAARLRGGPGAGSGRCKCRDRGVAIGGALHRDPPGSGIRCTLPAASRDTPYGFVRASGGAARAAGLWVLLHFTPTSASWLNLFERFFAEITTKRIRRGIFRSSSGAGIWFFVQVLQGRSELFSPFAGDGIAWWAHICGFVLGWVLLHWLEPWGPPSARYNGGPWEQSGRR